MKKNLNFSIPLFLCCFASLLLCCSVSAQSPSPPPTPTTLTTQIPKEKDQEIRDLVKEIVQEKIKEIKEKGKRKAYVGEIKEIDGLKITLNTKNGEREIGTDEETTLVDTKRKEIDLDSLEVDDSLICMGFTDAEGKMIAQRIVVIPKSPKSPIPRRAVYGQVTEVDEENQTLTIVHPQKEKISFRIKADSKTRITKKVEGKIQKIKFAEIKLDDRVVAVGSWDEEKEVLTAKIIHVIPGKATGLEKPTQSPSPTP